MKKIVRTCSLLLLTLSFIFVVSYNVSATLSEVEYVSLRSDGTLAGGVDALPPSITDDGRFIVFASPANDLLQDADGNTIIEPGILDRDIFIKDMQTGALSLLSVSVNGGFANGESAWPTITPDGRYVSFYSTAADLIAGDTNGKQDVFLIDRGDDNDESNNSIIRVSLTPDGEQITGPGAGSAVRRDSVSDDGNLVVFTTFSVFDGITDNNYNEDVYLWNRATGKTTLISHIPGNLTEASNGACGHASISADGKFIVFASTATNLTPDSNPDPDGFMYDVFLYDIAQQTTKLISKSLTNSPNSFINTEPRISADNNIIIWNSNESLSPVDTNLIYDVYMYDRKADKITVVSTFNYGLSAPQVDMGLHPSFSSNNASISRDGRFIAFRSNSTNMVPGINNPNIGGVFIHDTLSGDNIRLSVNPNGIEALAGSASNIFTDMTRDGKFVVFTGMHQGLVPGIDDTNGKLTLFLAQADWVKPTVTTNSLVPVYYPTGPNNFVLTFSEPMTKQDSISRWSIIKDVGAESKANYVLVSAGANDTLDTAACGASTGDDVVISTDSVVYDVENWTSTVSINGGTPLPVGKYRLFACGHDPYPPAALHDGVGNKMAADYIFDFVVAAEPTSTLTSTPTQTLTPTPTPTQTLTPTQTPSPDPTIVLPDTGFPIGQLTPIP